MKRRTLLTLWLLAWVALLATYSGIFRLGNGAEFGLLVLIVMLTFPSGLLLFWFLYMLGHSNFALPDGQIFAYVIIAVFIAVGYLQWFVVFPRLFRWLFGPNKSLNTDAPKDGAPVS